MSYAKIAREIRARRAAKRKAMPIEIMAKAEAMGREAFASGINCAAQDPRQAELIALDPANVLYLLEAYTAGLQSEYWKHQS